MKTSFRFVILCFIFLACNNPSTQNKIERAEEPDIYSTERDDKEMNNAIIKANETIGEFKTALLSKKDEYADFSLKVSYPTSAGNEHIWLNEITFRDTNFSGIVNNEPDNIEQIKFGDTVQIPNNSISDWLYTDKGRLKGGYTIRVIRNRMDKKEREAFDAEIGWIIE